MEFETNQGQINVIYGCMFSGKSSELMKRIRRLTYAKKKCLIVKYEHDNRFSKEIDIATHDQIIYKATCKCSKLEQIKQQYQSFDVIAIDEGQFFPDIVEVCDEMANNGKIVIVAALDATFQRKPFGNITNLLPIAENITKLNAICVHCQATASYSRRKVASKEIELIGAGEIYEPVCRKCFLILEKELENQKKIESQIDSPQSTNSQSSNDEEIITNQQQQ